MPQNNGPGAVARAATGIAKVNARATAAPRLQRETFRTSRLLEFCSVKELTAQTGHHPDRLAARHPEGVARQRDRCLRGGRHSAGNRGQGIDRARRDLDQRQRPRPAGENHQRRPRLHGRASSREAYCSPTRGAQGNALKTICAMPFCLAGDVGRIRVDADGLSHQIAFSVDQLRQEPVIAHEVTRMPTPAGTTVTVFWPDSACSILVEAKSRFVQIASDFAWLNPHARITLIWDGEIEVQADPSDTT